MTERAHPPKYTEELSTEWAILRDSEEYFRRRDENLRFELVKRVLQWMLDTDDNGWFEKTDSAQDKRPRTKHGHRDVIIRSSDWEILGYIRTLKGDVSAGRLTGEVDALYDLVVHMETVFKEYDELPDDYEKRRFIIQDAIMPEDKYERALRPISWVANEDQYKSM